MGRMWPKVKGSTAGLNLEFSFSLTSCCTKTKEPSLAYYLLIAVSRRDDFMSFSSALAQRETQTASFKLLSNILQSSSGIMVNMVDYNILVSEFELKLCCYVHFFTNAVGKGVNVLILPVMG